MRFINKYYHICVEKFAKEEWAPAQQNSKNTDAMMGKSLSQHGSWQYSVRFDELLTYRHVVFSNCQVPQNLEVVQKIFFKSFKNKLDVLALQAPKPNNHC